MAMRSLSDEEVDHFLRQQRILRLGMSSSNEHYLLALGYLWHRGALYCVTSHGRKTRIASENPTVSFQIDNSDLHGPFGWTSVVGQGEVRFLTDQGEIEEVSPLLFSRFSDMPEWAAKEYEERGAAGTMVWLKIEPSDVHGRESGPPQ